MEWKQFGSPFRQGLASNLHFRQWEAPNPKTTGNLKSDLPYIVNLRQLIASSRGKELVQGTSASFPVFRSL